MTLNQIVPPGGDYSASYGVQGGPSAIPIIVEWATNPVTMGVGVVIGVALFFHWLGKRSGRQIVVATTQPTAEELKKAEMERQVKRRRASLHNIAHIVAKMIVKEHKSNVRNPNTGLNAQEAFSVASRIFVELRAPDRIEQIKKDLGIITPKVDVKPAETPAAAPAAPTEAPVDPKEKTMADVKAAMAARRKAA